MPAYPGYRHVLPEIAVPRSERPTFPEACPRCGAPLTSRTQSVWPEVGYACGAAYTSKPQIQNHTDKWWGTCPRTEP